VKQHDIETAQRLLGACSLFSGLAQDERLLLVCRAKIKRFAAGQRIFSMGEPGNSMMAVLSGSVRISIPAASGKEVVLAILQPRQVFGEIAVLDGRERTADAQALTDSQVAVLERADVLAFFERHPMQWLKIVEVLCERLRRTDNQISDLALQPVPVRLAKTLLRLAEDVAPSTKGIEIPLSQRELGNFVGASRAGILRIEENIVVLTDRKSLDALAEGRK
jgi:CRP/FNR family transcriptional regulator, cyclic AMP receptor protein